jgi:hypothetical protein
VTTASNGSFTVLVPDSATSISIHATAAGTNVPSGDVLDNHPETAASLSGTSPSATGFETANTAVLSFTPASNTSYTGIAFDYWHALDTAPVWANGPGSAYLVTPAASAIVLFPSATVSDTQLDGSFAHDFSGTTLTLQRYVSNVATPNASDSFTGSGTASTGVFLNSANNQVLLNGTEVGTYSETGGKLSISFLATGISAAMVDSVLNGLAYQYTGASSAFVPGAVIGVQIDDANNDPIGLNGVAPDASGPHDQGPGGDLLSNVLMATVNVVPAAALTPVLSVVGGSNDTAGLGTQFDPNGQTAPGVLMTDGEIVRMRSTLQLPVGTDTAVSMTVALPTGLTLDPNALTDGSVTVLLVSPNGDTTTTLTGANLQLAENGTAANTAKLDLGTGADTTDPVVTALPAADISYNSATNKVTFSLGTLSNTDVAAQPSYAIVEFNTIVGPAVTGGTVLGSSMTGTANGATTAAVTDDVHTVAPALSLAKTVAGITYNPDGSATVTYVDTITNTGDGPAYGVSLADPGTGTGTASDPGTHSGSGTGIASSASGSSFSATLSSLPAGGAESFTYTVTIPAANVNAAVTDAATQATVTYKALNPADFTPATTGNEVLANTTETPPTYSATAEAGLDLVSGSVNQDTAATEGTDNPLVTLSGQTVSVSYPGQTGTESVTTASNGSFTVLVPDSATSISIHATAAGTNVPSGDVLDNHPETTGSPALPGASTTGFETSNTAVLSFTPAANTSYTGIAFDYWHALDTAPVWANGPTAPLPVLTGATVVPFANATVTDTQLDGSFAHDFSGTTLTLQRYVGTVAAPNPLDLFTGTGSGSSGLVLSGGSVQWNGSSVGNYTESGGKLTIRFSTTPGTVSATLVDDVLQNIGYSYTGSANPVVPATVLGVQIDDANNDPIGLNGIAPDASGPHDQGPGGDLLSNVLTATVDVYVLSPTLSIVGESNVTAGTSALFDPTGQTVPSAVTATDGDIVRMRASLELPEGSSTATSMTVTLPTDLTLDPNALTDGSVTVLLVSPNGDFANSLGSGQLAEGTTSAIDTTRLGLGTSSNDVVTTVLPASAISASGQTVTFNLGTLTNTDGSPQPHYVIVEFNTVVGSNVAATIGALDTTMQGSASGMTTATVNDYVTVEAPAISLQKVVEGITYNPDGSATITYVDTVTNNGNAPGYNVSLTDPGAGTGTVNYLGTSGNGTSPSGTPNATSFDGTVATLGAGQSQNFTYTVTIPPNLVTTAVSDSTSQATVTWNALNPANETTGKETLAGTSLTPPVYSNTAEAGLDVVSGTVNQDLSPTQGSDNPLQPLSDQSVNVTFAGQTGSETVQTTANGGYTVLVPDNGRTITVTTTAAGSNVPTSDTLDNHPDQAPSLTGTTPVATGSDPATLSFTPAASTSYAGVAFDFWRAPDTAPTLANGPASTLSVLAGATVVPFANATVNDTQLDGSFTRDYSGTTLTLQRYTNGVATPNASDVFTGSGSATSGLFLSSGGQVLWNGVSLGTYTETGGKLAITFTTTPGSVNATLVNDVLQHVAYSDSALLTPVSAATVLGVQIDDANSDPIGLNGIAPDTAGPHDQGPGGDLMSNVLTATLNVVVPIPPQVPTPAPEPAPAPENNGGSDDLSHPPSGANPWVSSDYLGNPIIPDLSLIGSVANRFVIVEQHAVVAVPQNIFQDTLDNAQLTYEAKLPDGSPLPNWLSFDQRSLTFSGTPPANSYGRVTILIRATDIAGQTADATFNILIGRRQEDLGATFSHRKFGPFQLPAGLKLGSAAHNPRTMAAALPAQRPTPVDTQPAPSHAVDAGHRHFAALLDAPLPPASPGGGFTGALRNAGQMGALARARALLDSLNHLNDNAA